MKPTPEQVWSALKLRHQGKIGDRALDKRLDGVTFEDLLNETWEHQGLQVSLVRYFYYMEVRSKMPWAFTSEEIRKMIDSRIRKFGKKLSIENSLVQSSFYGPGLGGGAETFKHIIRDMLGLRYCAKNHCFLERLRGKPIFGELPARVRIFLEGMDVNAPSISWYGECLDKGRILSGRTRKTDMLELEDKNHLKLSTTGMAVMKIVSECKDDFEEWSDSDMRRVFFK